MAMGMMINGTWTADASRPDLNNDGEFRRSQASVRNWITGDGRPGPTGRGGYTAEAGRYHLYIMEGCPWAHRTWLYHRRKQLAGVVGLSRVLPRPTDQGWGFAPSSDRYRDPVNGADYLHQIYGLGVDDYTGPVTVPVLWDRATRTVVNNESADIIRMFNSVFDPLTGNRDDYYPAELQGEIDAVNDRIYRDLNDAVYRAGFAGTQEAYERAVDRVFATLDWMEARLAARRYLCGDRITEADWRALPTLVRFDAAYTTAFGCNRRRIADYRHLSGYTRDLYQQPGVADTVLPAAAYHRAYHAIPIAIGHGRIVPVAPEIDFSAPHDRGARVGRAA